MQTLPRSTPRGLEKHDEKGHRARYGPEVRRLGHLWSRQPPQDDRVRDNYGRARTWPRPRQAIAWDALSRVRDQQEFSKGDPTVGRHRAPRANRTALAPAREAFWYFFGARLWTTSRPLSNGARASTRTYPIKAHRKCHRLRPPRVAWHVPPLLPSEKEARGSYKKPGELLIALSLRAEARGLFLQPCRDPAA